MYQIKFIEPQARIAGENKSKLLSPTCSLFVFMKSVQEKLTLMGVLFDERPPHIEISHKRDEEYTNLMPRVMLLENSMVSGELVMMRKKALVIKTGNVEGYGETHATVAYFKNGIAQETLTTLFELVRQA